MADGRGGARANSGSKPKTVKDATGPSYIEYSEARAKKERHQANLAEMEEAKKRRELVDVAQIMDDADKAGRMFRDSMLSLPDRVASLLVGRTEKEILHELNAEIRATLRDVNEKISNSNRISG